MDPWLKGALLTLALLAGVGGGWLSGKRLSLRMPHLAVSTLVLAVGSLGGPLLMERILGRGIWSYGLALVIAGAAAGLVFWPMGEKQGERQWL